METTIPIAWQDAQTWTDEKLNREFAEVASIPEATRTGNQQCNFVVLQHEKHVRMVFGK